MCTTHHDLLAHLKRLYPQTNPIPNRIFVEDGNVVTSAGISSGIDLSLYILEQIYNKRTALKVALDMVVYYRCASDEPQFSPWFLGRDHVDAKVHKVQDAIEATIDSQWDAARVTQLVNMSYRNFSRKFQKASGYSIQDYLNRLRTERAKELLAQSTLSMEDIATACGYQSVQGLRRAWGKTMTSSPSAYRKVHGVACHHAAYLDTAPSPMQGGANVSSIRN